MTQGILTNGFGTDTNGGHGVGTIALSLSYKGQAYYLQLCMKVYTTTTTCISTFYATTPNRQIVYNAWNHVAATITTQLGFGDGNNVQVNLVSIYINGTVIITYAVPATTILGNAGT